MASCGKNCINWWLCDEIGLNTHLHERDDVEKQCPYFFSRPEKKTIYWISCSTGCTCCADQIFDYGFYLNREDAAAQAEAWRNGINNPLCSQYAKYGRYYIKEDTAEVLPDGRWIVAGHVFGTDEVEYIGKLCW